MAWLAALLLLWAGAAKADFFWKAGTFARETGAEPDTQYVTGIGFTPKAYVLWGAFLTTSGTSSSHMNFGVGFGDATDAKAVWIGGADLSDSATVATSFDNSPEAALLEMANVGSPFNAACSTLFLAYDTIALVWHQNSVTANLVNYFTVGGTDVPNVKVGYDSIPTTTGNKDYAGVGFQGDAAIFLMPYPTTTFGSGSTLGNLGLCLGMATSSSGQGVATWVAEQRHTTRAWSWQSNSHCLAMGDSAGEELEVVAKFVNFGPDGYTLDFDTTYATRYWFAYMVIGGGTWKVGSETAPVATGLKETAVGFPPKGIFAFSWCDTAVTTPNDWTQAPHVRIDIGAAGPTAGSDEANGGGAFMDGVANSSDAARWQQSTKFLSLYYNGTPSLGAACDMNAFGASSFTANWTSADSARQFIYLAGGAETAVGNQVAIGGNVVIGGNTLIGAK